ncbi:MAG: hypothetical protein IKH29_06145 [Methanobrevibacter sp.]|uniref:hypothetical protein n=1 Tax=Methanobrevibacter sp. TaxID=66852 RepID=UPI0025F8E876|nr:hypothetical protein [Methanobrevibacter sp.]MBR3113281.1 hypothetical protein [Methanobrevibacter sp.]MBR6993405.1 hypothetical protein [Methanobrevibacter sp.]
MSRSWRKISITIFVALIVLSALFIVFNAVNGTPYTAQSVTEDYNLPIGQSMFENQSILGQRSQIELPLLSHAGFLTHQILALDIQGILKSLSTGIVPFDFSTVSSEGIDSYGNVVDVEGPGFLTFEGDKLAVKSPDNYVWGYSAPYKWLVKTANGVDVVENGTVVKSVPVDDIKNLEFSNEYYNNDTIVSWYNYDASEGSIFTLEKGMVGFSDGRNNISSSDVPVIFGQDVVDYAAEYPTGSPILLYSGNYTEQAGEVYGTSLGSHPEYGDSIREVNARQFVEAWNGTVIPPNSTSSGKDYVYFESATDASAPGGSAAHGVCPSARALRAAVTAEGFDLPTGMTWDENAVLFGFNPARDITVTNNHDYPVMIKMWTEGEGTGMGVYGQVVRYIPQ